MKITFLESWMTIQWNRVYISSHMQRLRKIIKLQKSYSKSVTGLIDNFSELKKDLFDLKIGIVYTQIKFCKEFENKVRVGKWSFGLV